MDKLGVEPVQLLLQAVNFVIMVFLLTKLLYKPILRVLNERRKKIAEGLAFSEKMKSEEEKLEKKRSDLVQKGKDEARVIIENAKNEAKKLAQEIENKAHQEAKIVLEKAKEEIEVEREEMERRLKGKTVSIAESMVIKILAETLNDQNQKTIINKRITSILKHTK